MIEHGRVIDGGPAHPDDPDDPADGIAEGLRGARPDHADVAAAVARARIAAKLFGATDVVRIGRYEIEARAGGGGGGDVFVARDPELSRRVAIKLIHGGGDRDRLLAEGQALARLSHPNIVPVYDAGTLGDQVYVVMELVDGDTLRTYGEAARGVRDIVRAYRQAAEGLAAAHRAGVIHRDFKPDNVLVGRDNRVRVVDFGLARSATDDSLGADLDPSSPVHVTRAGLGTPRYMAPEQAAHALLTPAADQYAFCASLRESVRARAPSVPRWLDAILRRGMATDPAARYPSMTAIHAALGRDPAWRWRRRGAVVGVLGFALAAFVVGRSDRATGPACDVGAELATTWSPAAAAQIAAHLAGLATPYARQAAPGVIATLDDYALRWRAGAQAACLAHHAGAQSAAMYDRRNACLARAHATLATGVAVVRDVPSTRLADAISALAELPDLARCSDVAALATPVAPPPPSIASAVAAASNELAALEIEVRAARPSVRPRIDPILARARALGYPPLVARTLRLAGLAALAVKDFDAAVPSFTEALTIALTQGDLPLAVEAFARRIFAGETVAPGLDLVAAIAAGLPAADNAARVLLDNSVGTVALAAGHRDQARIAFERALVLAREVRGPARVEAAGVWGNVALVIDDAERQRALARERTAIVEAALGASHPLVLDARIASAYFETDRAAVRAALEPPCERLAELQPDHARDILSCQFQLGWLAIERADPAAARRAFARASDTAPRAGNSAKLWLSRAYLDLLDERLDAASRDLDAALAALGPLDHAAWYVLIDAADVTLARGAIAHAQSRPVEARAAYQAASRSLAAVAPANLPRHARRLAFARASLIRSWGDTPLSPEVRDEATAALAWYRSAGGYADVVAALEHALAR